MGQWEMKRLWWALKAFVPDQEWAVKGLEEGCCLVRTVGEVSSSGLCSPMSCEVREPR